MIWLLTTVQQALLFSATILLVGCVAWRVVVAPGARAALVARHEPVDALINLEPVVIRCARLSALALVAAWGLRMVVQVIAFRDPFAPLRDDVSLLLFQTVWGSVWMTQGVVVAVLLVVLFAGVRPRADGEGDDALDVTASWGALLLLTLALAATLAMSGHAMGVAPWRAAAVTADALHTVAAGTWIGTLAVILTASRSSVSGAARGEGEAAFGAQIRRFSPLALLSGGVLLTMGAALSYTHLTAVSDLWQTGYGRVLSGKIGLVVVIFGVGFWNWRRGVPISDSADGMRDIRRRGTWEVGVAAGVLLLTAILVHSTKP